MNNSFIVSGLKPLGHLLGDVERIFQVERTVFQLLTERFTLDILQDQETSVACPIKPVNRGDVGMVQRRKQLSLALEPGDPLHITGHLIGQHLDGHLTVEVGIFSAIDLTHPPRAQRSEDFVRTEPCAII